MVLSQQECIDLLTRVPIGRVALTLNALPVIFPVNYRLIGDSVVFGAMAGSSLSKAADGAIAAFQADSYDDAKRSGWTVMAVGQVSHLRDSEVLGRLELDGQLPEPWALGESAERYFQIGLQRVSGHRIV
jgi:nitroimidazol reductase NimA-like FMN-containing flavoprotein (pyridoxamine 5'-phosphate oxidase superfamily)